MKNIAVSNKSTIQPIRPKCCRTKRPKTETQHTQADQPKRTLTPTLGMRRSGDRSEDEQEAGEEEVTTNRTDRKWIHDEEEDDDDDEGEEFEDDDCEL